MNGYIASTITVHTSSLVTRSNAGTHFNPHSQSRQSPEHGSCSPRPRGSPGTAAAGHPRSQPRSGNPSPPSTLQLMAQGYNLQPADCKWRTAFSRRCSSGNDFTWGFYEGTLARDLYSPDHWYGYGYVILFPATAEACGRDRGEQKERTPSPQCSGDICTKMQETSGLPCSFSTHLSVASANAKCCIGSGKP